jgi:hypothetical protein
MHMIGHQMPLLDGAILLLRQTTKHLPKLPAYLPKFAFFRYFGMNTT